MAKGILRKLSLHDLDRRERIISTVIMVGLLNQNKMGLPTELAQTSTFLPCFTELLTTVLQPILPKHGHVLAQLLQHRQHLQRRRGAEPAGRGLHLAAFGAGAAFERSVQLLGEGHHAGRPSRQAVPIDEDAEACVRREVVARKAPGLVGVGSEENLVPGACYALFVLRVSYIAFEVARTRKKKGIRFLNNPARRDYRAGKAVEDSEPARIKKANLHLHVTHFS